jgi:hypothetical protein
MLTYPASIWAVVEQTTAEDLEDFRKEKGAVALFGNNPRQLLIHWP